MKFPWTSHGPEFSAFQVFFMSAIARAIREEQSVPSKLQLRKKQTLSRTLPIDKIQLYSIIRLIPLI